MKKKINPKWLYMYAENRMSVLMFIVWILLTIMSVIIILFNGTTIPLLLTIPIANVGVFIADNLDKKELTYVRTLPLNLYRDKSWRNIIDALENGKHAFEPKENEKHKKTLTILKHAFFKSDRNTSIDDTQIKRDIENAVLWNHKLSQSPLIERIAFLLTLTSTDEQKTFAELDEDKLHEFMQPFDDLLTYVERIHDDSTFRDDELRKRNVASVDSIKKNQMEQRLDYALKNMFRQ